MTIRRVIDTIDHLKPNQYTTPQKVAWLSECDADIHRNIVLAHELPPGMPAVFTPYDAATDMDRELIAQAPHDALYSYWIQAQIDLYNRDVNGYNNTAKMYTEEFDRYERWYNRHHMPIQRATHIKL